MTFKESLTKSLTKGLVAFAGIALYLIASVYSPFNGWHEGNAMNVRPNADGSVSQVIEQSGCERHYGPDFPTGVVYIDADDRAHFSDNPKIVGKALDAALGGKPWKHTPSMFCL